LNQRITDENAECCQPKSYSRGKRCSRTCAGDSTTRLCVRLSCCRFPHELSRAQRLTERVETLGACSVMWGIVLLIFEAMGPLVYKII